VKIGRVLVSAEEIDAKLAEMGAAIMRDYEGRDLLLVGVLKGAFVVMADLALGVEPERAEPVAPPQEFELALH